MPPLSFHEAIAGIMKARRHYPAGSPDGKGGQFMPSDAVGGASGASGASVWGEAEIKASMRRGRDAMRSLIALATAAEPDDAAKMAALQAMSRPEIGDIDFHWGKPGRLHQARNRYVQGSGVSHLIAQRDHDRMKGISSPPGKAVAMLMPVVIARGTLGEPYGPEGGRRVNVHYRGFTAVLSEGGSGHWILTGWQDFSVPGAVRKQSHLPHSYARRTFVSRSGEGAGTTGIIAPFSKEEKTMQPMNFLDALKMVVEQSSTDVPTNTAPLSFSKALAQMIEKGHFRHADGKFRVGTPVALTDLQDIEADVPDDDAGLLDAVEKFTTGEVPPPIDIAVDPDGNRVLVRGKKRLAAARKTGQATIPVRFTNVAEPFGKAGDEPWLDWHGHVRPRPDGAKMRCGGPNKCLACQAETAEVEAQTSITPPLPRTLVSIDDKTSYPPFPFDQTVFARIRPDQVPRFLGVLTDRERWPLQKVKLSDLLAMQNRVDTGKVLAKVENGGGGHEPIVVMLDPGRLHIADGHHDLAAAWLRGEDEKAVRFADLTAVSNVLKADMPVAALTQVRLKPEHQADDWFLQRVGDAVGSVIAAWVVQDGPNAGKVALAVEWLTPGICGMYRGLDAAKVEVVESAAEQGVYSSVKPDAPSEATITAWIAINHIPNAVPAGTLHATIVYSRAPVPGYVPSKAEVKVDPASYRLGILDGKLLVLHFVSPDLTARHNAARFLGATWDYPAYQPHITLSSDIGDFEWSNLAPPDFAITLGNETVEPLNVEWNPTVAKTSSPDRFSLSANICKVDDDQRLVFGWFSIVEIDGQPVTDREGDRIAPDELERAAYGHVLNARVASDTHVLVGVGDLIESCVFTAEKQEAMLASLTVMGIPAALKLHCVGWWGGYKITEERVWQAVKAGDYVSFSIGGTGTRTPVEKAGRARSTGGVGRGGNGARHFDESEHSRVPAGDPDGGQFTSGAAGAGVDASQHRGPATLLGSDPTENEKAAIKVYTGGDYLAINRELRGIRPPSGRFDDVVKNLDSFLERQAFPEKTVVYRGVGGGAAKAWANLLAKGKIIEDPAFTSSSSSLPVAKVDDNIGKAFARQSANGLTLHITIPKGAKAANIAPWSDAKGEFEIFIGRSANFRVVKYLSKSKDVYVELIT